MDAWIFFCVYECAYGSMDVRWPVVSLGSPAECYNLRLGTLFAWACGCAARTVADEETSRRDEETDGWLPIRRLVGVG